MFRYLLILSAVALVAMARSTRSHVNMTHELLKEQWVIAAVGINNGREKRSLDKPHGNVEECIWFSARITKRRSICNVNGEDHLIGSIEFVGQSGVAKEQSLATGPIYEVSNSSRNEIMNVIKSIKCRDAYTHKGKRVVFAISPIDYSLNHFFLVANTGGPKHFVLQTSIITKEFIPLPALKYLIDAVNKKDIPNEPEMTAMCYKE